MEEGGKTLSEMLKTGREFGILLIRAYILKEVWAKAVLAHISFNFLISTLWEE